MFDTSVIEKIAPEMWRSSYLSIARFYGAASINGVTYVHDLATDFLIRKDVYEKELAEKKNAKAEQRKAAEGKQGNLF